MTQGLLALLVALATQSAFAADPAANHVADRATTVASFGEAADFLAQTTRTLAVKPLPRDRARVFSQGGFVPRLFFDDVETTKLSAYLAVGMTPPPPVPPTLPEQFRSIINKDQSWRVGSTDTPCIAIAYWDGNHIQVVGFWGNLNPLPPGLMQCLKTEANFHTVRRLVRYVKDNEPGWTEFP